MYFFSLSLYSSCPLIWVFRVSFCTHEGTLPYRSSAQMSCREDVGVSFVALGVLEPQIARHWFRSAAISRHLTNSVGRSLLRSAFLRVRPQFICGHPRGRGLCWASAYKPKAGQRHPRVSFSLTISLFDELKEIESAEIGHLVLQRRLP
jgi:hypothetical protein